MLWILIQAVLDLMQCTYKVTKLNSYYFIHINHKLVLNGEHKQHQLFHSLISLQCVHTILHPTDIHSIYVSVGFTELL